MPRKTRPEDELIDDGRTIVDMSGVESHAPTLFPRKSGRRENEPVMPAKKNPYGEEEVTSEQRRWYIGGVLKAVFMIMAVYAVVYFIVILVIYLVARAKTG